MSDSVYDHDPLTEDGEKDEPSDAEVREQEIHSTVQRMLEDAVQHYKEKIEPAQAEATEYFMCQPFGDEVEGRSRVISSDVRDVVLAMMPSILRILFGHENVVEYRARPKSTDDVTRAVAVAKQATDYVNLIIREDNDGFVEIHAALQDALVRRLGVIKYWYEPLERIVQNEVTNASESQVLMLQSDPSLEIEVVSTDTTNPEQPLHNVKITRKDTEHCFRIAAIPNEEFIFTKNAKSIDEAPLVAHVREARREELIALGIDEEVIDEALGKERNVSSANLKIVRSLDAPDSDFEQVQDESTRPIVYAEAYVLVDADGDGIAERRLFKCVGPDFKVVNGTGDIVDEPPFAAFTAFLLSHLLMGLSAADLAKDLQRIKSQIQRGTLDSLSLSLDQKMEVVSSEVNMQDLLNREVGGLIRVRKPGMIREVKHEFVGADTLSALEYFDEVKENRLGISKASAGLDADALQSSTKAAVAATLSASQQRIEMVVRAFTETGMKRLFRGLLREIVRHQDRPRLIRLRGEFVEMDPREWDADMDVIVNVALGSGSVEDRINVLTGIAQRQAELMQMQSPIVSWVEHRATLAMITELAGFPDTDKFWKPFGEAEAQQMMQNAPPPPPDPKMLLVELEKQKLEVQTQAEAHKQLLEQRRVELEDGRERIRIANDFALKQYEIDMKYHGQTHNAWVQADADREIAAQDADVARHNAVLQAGVDAHATETQAGVDAHATATQAAVDQHATETQAGVDQHATEVAAASQPDAGGGAE